MYKFHNRLYFVYGVTKQEIKGGKVKNFLRMIEEAERQQGNLANKVILEFQGYDHDPREVYEIPEIRKWVQKVYKQKPNIFYYLCDFSETMLISYLCLVDSKAVVSYGGRTKCEFEIKPRLITEIIINATNFLIHSGGDSTEVKALADRISNALLRTPFKNSNNGG